MFGRGKNRKFGKGHWRKGSHRGHGKCHKFGLLPLEAADINKKYIVMCNPDRKTVEMGIFSGGVITVHKNDPTDSNLIVAVGESRYIIPRDLARRILIK